MRDFTEGKCDYEEVEPGYDHARCVKCGAVVTDSMWDLARLAWFPSLADARFYDKNGRMPEKPRERA